MDSAAARERGEALLGSAAVYIELVELSRLAGGTVLGDSIECTADRSGRGGRGTSEMGSMGIDRSGRGVRGSAA